MQNMCLLIYFFVDTGVCMSFARVCTSEYECVFGARSLRGLAVTHTYTPVCANERLLSPRKPACCQVATWRERERGREGRKERGGKKEWRKDGEKNHNQTEVWDGAGEKYATVLFKATMIAICLWLFTSCPHNNNDNNFKKFYIEMRPIYKWPVKQTSTIGLCWVAIEEHVKD